MTQPLRILFLLIMLATTAAWQAPAFAGRLATVAGEAAAEQVTESQQFRLAEQAQITVGYVVEARGEKCSVQVRIYRQLPNGNWAVVNTPLRANGSSKGAQPISLPAGDYRIEVVAQNAAYTVTIDKP